MSEAIAHLTSSPDAEASVIGSCVLKPDCIGWVGCDERDFTVGRWRELWRAMVAVYERDEPVDEVTLEAELRRRGTLEAVGGQVAIAEAQLEVPTADNVEHYAGILREHRISRDTLSAAEMARQCVETGTWGTEALEETLAALSRVERPQKATAVTAVEAARAELEQIGRDLERGASGGIKSGLDRLDAETGGLTLGETAVIAARPGVGKSLTGLAVADHVAKSDQDGVSVIFTWEDPVHVYVRRLLSNRTRIPHKRIKDREFYAGELNRLMLEYTSLPENLLIVSAHGRQMRDVARELRGLCARRRVRLAVFDYVQRIPSPSGSERRDLGIGEAIQMAEDLAVEYDFAPVFLSQLKRPENEKDAPTINQLKDSGVIEQIAKLVVALWETDPGLQGDEHAMTALILKQNGGEKHVRCRLGWHPAIARVA